jgi:hypothetical protein
MARRRIQTMRNGDEAKACFDEAKACFKAAGRDERL